jgi:hypothetical protein
MDSGERQCGNRGGGRGAAKRHCSILPSKSDRTIHEKKAGASTGPSLSM